MSINEKRQRIKKTVDMVVPPLDEIDTTRVLTDEEQAELARRFEEAKTNRELAELLGREGLRAALKMKLSVAQTKAEKLTRHLEKKSLD